VENKPTALIIGGSSGLGLELGFLLSSTHNVVVTGRENPKDNRLNFQPVFLYPQTKFPSGLAWQVEKNVKIDLLIYSVGFYQDGRIDELTDTNIDHMVNVGLLAPAKLLQRILKQQGILPGFIAITSTSQWTPRLCEPVYTAVKAGLGMLANSISKDDRVGKVLVAAPAGMNTKFWRNNPKDLSGMLDPKWVAEQILQRYDEKFKYRCMHILRGPTRVEVVETRLAS
jgi:short-subunit dehydrogenase